MSSQCGKQLLRFVIVQHQLNFRHGRSSIDGAFYAISQACSRIEHVSHRCLPQAQASGTEEVMASLQGKQKLRLKSAKSIKIIWAVFHPSPEAVSTT